MLYAVYYSSCILLTNLFVESFTADFVTFGSYEYHFGLNKVKSFDEANRNCVALDASLVVIKNEETRNILVNDIRNLNLTDSHYSFYIGLKRIGSSSDFQWIDGSMVLEEVKYWKDSEPNNRGGNENCVIMGWKYNNDPPYKWYDVECNIRSRYICQRDINECNLSSVVCHINSHCTNTMGSYYCLCNNGYSKDGEICTDVNECDNTEACHRDASCSNTEGSFNCKCNDGYNGDGKSCADIDECETANGCHHNSTCSNTQGSYICTCNDGYTGNGNNCQDVNECDSSEACHRNASCSNTEGSFNCKCNDGYSGDGKSCADIDECDNTEACDGEASCNNTEGSFNCKCNEGYTGDGKSCADIDECDDTEACHRDASCSNIEGSFNCICSDGYTGDGKSCADIDECDNTEVGLCHRNATCNNTEGSFNCKCNDGYTGDGKYCADLNSNKSNLPVMIIAISAGSFLLLAIIIVAVIVIYRRKKKNSDDPEDKNPVVTYTNPACMKSSPNPNNEEENFAPTGRQGRSEVVASRTYAETSENHVKSSKHEETPGSKKEAEVPASDAVTTGDHEVVSNPLYSEVNQNQKVSKKKKPAAESKGEDTYNTVSHFQPHNHIPDDTHDVTQGRPSKSSTVVAPVGDVTNPSISHHDDSVEASPVNTENYQLATSSAYTEVKKNKKKLRNNEEAAGTNEEVNAPASSAVDSGTYEFAACAEINQKIEKSAVKSKAADSTGEDTYNTLSLLHGQDQVVDDTCDVLQGQK